MSTSRDEAIQAIRDLAVKHNLAVSIVTVEDVLCLHGVSEETQEQVDAIVDSYEWRHYGDQWHQWFGYMEILNKEYDDE